MKNIIDMLHVNAVHAIATHPTNPFATRPAVVSKIMPPGAIDHAPPVSLPLQTATTPKPSTGNFLVKAGRNLFSLG